MNPRHVASLQIADRVVGPGEPVYVIAELSANHGQDVERARELVHAAKEAGADAVKLQTYTADTLTIDSDKDYFVIKGGTLWDERSLYELYAEAYTPWEWHGDLKALAESLGLALFSSPFDDSAVEFLEGLGVPAYKVASPEIVDTALVRRIAQTGKPMIVSTGMASLPEISRAVEVARAAGASQVALLRCNSSYPAPAAEMDLRTIPHMAATWGVPVGLSDHTLGITAAITAVSLGACLIEKHFTLSRADGGPDSSFSLEPDEFRDMVRAVREAEQALGAIRYGPSPSEEKSRVFRRSLFATRDVRAGERFTHGNVRSIRPGHGLPPDYMEMVLGRVSTKDIERGTPLSWALIGGPSDLAHSD